MKNKFVFFFNSIKQSIVGKPFAFVLLFLIFFATTICCSIPSRWLSGGLNEEYSTATAMSFHIAPQDFAQNNITIGDYINDNSSNIAYDERGFFGDFTAHHFKVEISANDNTINFDEIKVIFALTQQYGITEDDITNKNNVIAVRDIIALEYGIKVGDKINLYGNELVVQNLFDDYYDFAVPYNLQIKEWYSCTSPTDEFEGDLPTEHFVRGEIHNITYEGEEALKKGLVQLSCIFTSYFNASIFVVVILVLGMLAICVLSAISIMLYWLKCNSKKYATYKTLGCSPAMLTVAMIIETLLIAIVAIGFGLIGDCIIGLVMQFELPLGMFAWLHYLILTVAPLVSAIIMTVIAVAKRAIAMPADTKYN